MIAEIKYLLGFVGRFITLAFISTVIWTFPGRILHKLLHLGDDPNLLWPRRSSSHNSSSSWRQLRDPFCGYLIAALKDWGYMDWVGSFFTTQDISTVLLPKERSLRMCHSYDQYQIHLWLFNIIEFFLCRSYRRFFFILLVDQQKKLEFSSYFAKVLLFWK